MRHKFTLVVMAAALSIVWAASRAQTAEEIRARTAPGLSVGSQRLLFLEQPASNPASRTPFTPASTVFYTEPGNNTAAVKADIERFRARVSDQRNRFSATSTKLDHAETYMRSATYGSISVGLYSAWTGIGVFGSALVVAGTTIADMNIKLYRDEMTRKHKGDLSTLYGAAWAEMTQENAGTTTRLRSQALSDDPVQQGLALDTLLGAKAALFEGTNVLGMSEEERFVAQPYLIEALKEGLAKERRLSAEEIQQTRARVNAVERGIEQLKSETNTRFGELRDQIALTAVSVGKLEGKVDQLASSLTITNSVIFGSLSSSQQLRALDRGFDIGLTPKEREDLAGQLRPKVTEEQRVERIQSLQAAASEVFGVAGSVAKVARAVGIDVPDDVFTGIQYGQAAVSVVAAFAIGPLGGLSALGNAAGLLGGGSGPDPTTMRMMREIQKTLGEVVKLQRETLEKLDAIDKKLSSQHSQVMNTLARIESKVDRLLDIAISDAVSKLQSCRDFSNGMSRATTAKGYDSLYEAMRQAHNFNDDVRSAREQCNDVLRDILRITDSRPHWYLRNRAGASDEQEVWSKTNTAFYKPALEFTVRELKLANKPVCANRAFAAWVQMPNRLPDMDAHARTVCPDTDYKVSAGESGYSLSTGDGFDVLLALGEYLHHDSPIPGRKGEQQLLSLLKHQLALAPFYELLYTSGGGRALFADIKQIQRQRGKVNPDLAANRLASFLDIAAIAAAQETIMSGAPVSDRIVAYLRTYLEKKAFGFNPSGDGQPFDLPNVKQPEPGGPAERFWQHCDIAGTPEIKPPHLLCLLERHPQMLANSLSHWVRSTLNFEAAQKPGAPQDLKYTSLTAFDAGFQRASLDFMNTILPGMNWKDDADGTYGFVLRTATSYVPDGMKPEQVSPGWYFKMHRLDRSVWYTPLVGAFEAEEAPLRYRLQAADLVAVRRVALDEFEKYAAHLRTGPGDIHRLIETIALKEAQTISQSLHRTQ